MRFGLIGKSLTHSFSPQYFREKFNRENLVNYTYQTFPIDRLEQFPELLASKPEIRGLNVTIPYKTDIISYLDEIDAKAREIGAVNTIAFFEKKLFGYNTDAPAFGETIETLHQKPETALILGTGGASLAVAQSLKEKGITYQHVSRNPDENQLSYQQITDLSKFDLIVNCTPLGTFPNVQNAPNLPYHTLSPQQILYDLVYNPNMTVFLQHGKTRGCQIMNGYAMLVRQAELAWEIWKSTF
ncbi:MAG: shikimate dehydrogenase [Cryomorphaceae bacterium]|nr:shikimate dehydrogenase [Cryomorphaceae bacterium]